MYPPIFLGTMTASFLSAYMEAKRPKRITPLNIDIEEIKKEIREICKDKICDYCGRTNRYFVKNCEGCGAPK